MPPVFLGVIFHWLGGLASGSFYVPYRFVRKWAWEVYWLAGGFVSWIIAPWVLALILTKSVGPTIYATWTVDPNAIYYSFLFGMMWGVGGLTFGLTMRYLGMSLGMAVALGYCTVLGTLMPPIVKGTFMTQIIGSEAGWVNLFGLGICALGIALAAAAGMSKEREMSDKAKRESIKEFSFVKGMIVATISGVFSAGMAYGMAAAEPIAVTSQYFGTEKLWSGLPKLCVILLGGFTTNFLWCLFLLLKNGTMYQFFSSRIWEGNEKSKGGKAGDEAGIGVVTVSMSWNYFFAALAGLTWYMQFFFYSMGETKMGEFQFSSWTLHMASIIIFSSLWGLALREWKGSSMFTKFLLMLGIGTLLFSTVVVGFSNYMNAHSSTTQTEVQRLTLEEGQADATPDSGALPAGMFISKRPLTAEEIERLEKNRAQTQAQMEQAAKKQAQTEALLKERFPQEPKEGEVNPETQEPSESALPVSEPTSPTPAEPEQVKPAL